jgi:DnaJ-class molecular chaperone
MIVRALEEIKGEPIIGKSGEGTYQCPDCKGTGERETTDHITFWKVPCWRCRCRGELDWIEYVTRRSQGFTGVSC